MVLEHADRPGVPRGQGLFRLEHPQLLPGQGTGRGPARRPGRGHPSHYTYTMDTTRWGKVREYLAGKADLVGAIRLPGTAFFRNAGTDVTTDILILRK
ncbi:hypothetical protein [Solidesulfovibrio sp. C21]|uniref:hypothetical protein n=1 Tax=Solidesulfovibrio sp. C21 TaxID=3398613 RepID=UPI0039FBC45B